MSKITFRADDDLVEDLETFDASKSEVLRDALREYLDARTSEQSPIAGDRSAAARDDEGRRSIDELVADRIDALVAARVDEALAERPVGRRGPQDVNVTVTLETPDGVAGRKTVAESESADEADRKTAGRMRTGSPDGRGACDQCGETLSGEHVYCPNCGEKSAHRVFCECGDEVRSDWAFCPSCGRRTPAADVLESPR